MIEIRHLRALSLLRETGSLVRAAERLHLTQSALSHLFREMEERHGQALFVRKSRPLRFTSAGLRLLQLADDVLPRMAVAQRDLARLASGDAGRLNIAIECHSCYQWLMPTLDAYREDWPQVELDLSSGFHFAPLPALTRGDLDLVVTSNPDESLRGIHYEPLFSFEMCLAVSRKHPLAARKWVAPQDLAGEVQITYPVERERLDIFQQFLDPADVEPASVRTAELTVMMVQLVVSGRGVCALPNWALHDYLQKGQKGLLTQLRLGEKGLWSRLYAAVREEMLEQAFVRDFFDTARATCFANLNGVRPA